MGLQELIIEDRQLRDKLVVNTDVLSIINPLFVSPNQSDFTIQMVADYYDDYNIDTLNSLIRYHRKELDQDGLKVLSGEELKNFVVLDSNMSKYVNSKTRFLTILPKRAVLRIGMLLTKSPTAEKIRTYLLNVEEQSSPEQKQTAIENTEWDGLDILLYDCIVQTVMNENGTLNQACETIAPKIGKTPNQCKHRFNKHIRPNITNDILIHKIKHNRRGFDTWEKNKELKQNQAEIIPMTESFDIQTTIQHPDVQQCVIPDYDENEELPDVPGCRKTTKEELMLNFVLGGFEKVMAFMESLHNDKTKLLEEEIKLMRDKIAFLESQAERYRQTAINQQF